MSEGGGLRQNLTNHELRCAPIDVNVVSGGGQGGGLTDVQLRASPVPISGTVTANVSGTVPVSGSFFQATQPVSIAATVAVSGPLTDAQLRAAAVPVSGTFWPGTQPVSGPLTDAQLRQSAVPVTGSLSVGGAEVNATFRGRVCTFRTPGRAGTAGQKIFALHNASGSTRIVHINQLTVDLYCTVVKAITVPPPVIRIHRFTAVPTNGTSLTRVAKDSGLSPNASVTAWGDASADGAGSGTTLAVTIPGGSMLTEEFAPRFITAVGYEMFDRTELLDGKDVVLRAGEGIVVFLDYASATQNPVTDMWIATCDWYEI